MAGGAAKALYLMDEDGVFEDPSGDGQPFSLTGRCGANGRHL